VDSRLRSLERLVAADPSDRIAWEALILARGQAAPKLYHFLLARALDGILAALPGMDGLVKHSGAKILEHPERWLPRSITVEQWVRSNESNYERAMRVHADRSLSRVVKAHGGRYYAVVNDSVYRTTDNGNSWSLAMKLSPAPKHHTQELHVWARERTHGVEFVVVGYYEDAEGVRRVFSSVDGLTWTASLTGACLSCDYTRDQFGDCLCSI